RCRPSLAAPLAILSPAKRQAMRRDGQNQRRKNSLHSLILLNFSVGSEFRRYRPYNQSKEKGRERGRSLITFTSFYARFLRQPGFTAFRSFAPAISAQAS